MIQHLWLFIVAELVFSATPGPAVMLVSASGLRGGVAAAFAAVAGIQTANAIYITVSALGLGALIMASGAAFTAVKIAGALYLIFLGLRALWNAHAKETPVKVRGRPYGQALVTQLANPKAILFFSAFLPQFLDRSAPLWPQYLLMFAIIVAGETLILGFYGWIAAQGRRMAGWGRWPERISGLVLITIGVLFAAATRP